jgi:hypothetical protein
MSAGYVRDYGHASGSGNTIVTTVTMTAGNMAVIFPGAQGAWTILSVTDSAGNVWTAAGSIVTNSTLFGGVSFQVWTCKITTGGSVTITVTFSTSVAGSGMVGAESSGVDSVDRANGQGINGVPSGLPITTSSADEILLTYVLTNAGGQSVGSGQSLSYTDSSYNLLEYKIVSSVGTYTGTTVGAGSQQFVALTVSLRTAPVAGAAKPPVVCIMQ